MFEEFVHPRILKHGRIFRTRIMGSPTVVVNGAEANKFLLSNEFKLVKSSWPSSSVELMGRDSIMEKDGGRHRFLRGVIGTSLGYAGLELLVPKLCNSVQFHLATNWKGQEKISLYRSTKVLSFSVVFECLTRGICGRDLIRTRLGYHEESRSSSPGDNIGTHEHC